MPEFDRAHVIENSMLIENSCLVLSFAGSQQLLNLLLRVTHRLASAESCRSAAPRGQRDDVSASHKNVGISRINEDEDEDVGKWQSTTGQTEELDACKCEERGGDEDYDDAVGGGNIDDDEGGFAVCGMLPRDGDEADSLSAYLPETLDATALLVSRVQAVMVRAWDPRMAYLSPILVNLMPGIAPTENFPMGVIHVPPVTASGPSPSPAGLPVKPSGVIGSFTPAVTGRVAGTNGILPGPVDDPLADTFLGSTRRIRKWDWVRCCHSPVNPALAASGAGAPGADGTSPQSVIPPVAIDPVYCHRTLRPGRPGPEGCTLEQVRSWDV